MAKADPTKDAGARTGSTSLTVRKSLDVMDSFLDRPEGYTLTQLAARNGMSKATALRLCATLEACGYLDRDERMVYRIGPKVLRLAQGYRHQFRLETVVRPVLQRLRDQTGESASFYIAEHTERVCLVRENSRHVIRHHLEEGTRLPLHEGVVGRVLQAFQGAKGRQFDRIRADGVLMARGREPHTASVAAPVHDMAGRLIGALVISGPYSRFDAGRQHGAAALLLGARDDIARHVPLEGDMGKPTALATQAPVLSRAG